jgi:hypothetical protein
MTQVVVLGHRGPRVTKLVGDQARRQRRLVQDRRRRLAEGVRGDPRQRVPTARLSQLASHVGRVTKAAEHVREQRLVQPRAGHEPASQDGRGTPGQRQGPLPARLFVPFCNSPSPFTRIRVLVMSTVPASKSTSDHSTANAFPIRQPVASMKNTRSGRSRLTAFSSARSWRSSSIRSEGLSCRLP